MNATLANRFKSARGMLGLSAQALGELMGLGSGWKNIYNWENRGNPPLEMMSCYHALGVDLNWLITGVGSPYNDTPAGARLRENAANAQPTSKAATMTFIDAENAYKNMMTEVPVSMTVLQAEVLRILAARHKVDIGTLLAGPILTYCESMAIEVLQ
ncbi:MAG: helix-turn-helix domain-containing protein [Bacteroidetes bacterium]|nr:helix-turn-helix domain-containing protein [Bacteroidota bacterium]